MLAAPMVWTRLALLCLLAFGLAACGTQELDLKGETDASVQRGGKLFVQRCSGCHTLRTAGAEGSAVKVNTRERKDGPNFNARKEDKADVLYAIRNGGFSSSPMPQDIVVGQDAEDVANFLSKYSGADAQKNVAP